MELGNSREKKNNFQQNYQIKKKKQNRAARILTSFDAWYLLQKLG